MTLISYYFWVLGIICILLGIYICCGKALVFPKYILSVFNMINSSVLYIFIIKMIIEHYEYISVMKYILIVGIYSIMICCFILQIQKRKGMYYIINAHYESFKEVYIRRIKELDYIVIDEKTMSIDTHSNRSIKCYNNILNEIIYDISDYKGLEEFNTLVDVIKDLRCNIKGYWFSILAISQIIIGIVSIITGNITYHL